MRRTISLVCAAALTMALTAYADGPTPHPAKQQERIGVYDPRAIAIAFVESDAFSKWMSKLKAEYQKAKAAGDQQHVRQLEKKGAKRQNVLPRQGYSTVSVDDTMECIKDQLPGIKKECGVDLLVSKWDKDTLAMHPSAELVDVTTELIDAFHPNARQRETAIEILKHGPVPLGRAKDIEDCRSGKSSQ